MTTSAHDAWKQDVGVNVDDFDLGHNPTLHLGTNLQAASIQRIDRARQENALQNQEKRNSKNQIFVRAQIQLLLDKDTFTEDGRLANSPATGLRVDGVVPRATDQVEMFPNCRSARKIFTNYPRVPAQYGAPGPLNQH
jgi:hypothetical protein